MSQPRHAVYKGGQLGLLDPVQLTEGQEIRVRILSEEDRVRAPWAISLCPTPLPLRKMSMRRHWCERWRKASVGNPRWRRPSLKNVVKGHDAVFS